MQVKRIDAAAKRVDVFGDDLQLVAVLRRKGDWRQFAREAIRVDENRRAVQVNGQIVVNTDRLSRRRPAGENELSARHRLTCPRLAGCAVRALHTAATAVRRINEEVGRYRVPMALVGRDGARAYLNVRKRCRGRAGPMTDADLVSPGSASPSGTDQ